MRVYTVYDLLAERGGPLFEAENNAVAVRNVRQMVSKSGFPEDYCLYYVGEYFPEDPVFTALVKPEKINLGVFRDERKES